MSSRGYSASADPGDAECNDVGTRTAAEHHCGDSGPMRHQLAELPPARRPLACIMISGDVQEPEKGPEEAVPHDAAESPYIKSAPGRENRREDGPPLEDGSEQHAHPAVALVERA